MKKQLLSFAAAVAITITLIQTHTQAQTPYLWGMTSGGGPDYAGNIFTCTLSGTVTDVFDFTNGVIGGSPQGSLIQATNGLLYGLTQQGGANYLGTLFSYNISTGKQTVLYSFSGSPDGEDPGFSLFQASNGLLYGTTAPGGNNNNGVIFSYDISTSTYNVEYTFGGSPDAENPHGNFVQVGDSLLYGTTFSGGANDEGTVYSYNIYSHKEKVLHNFLTHPDESGPTGTLILANDGLLYGMTYAGGTYGNGVIYSFNTVTDSVMDLYNIGTNSDDAYNPLASLVQVNNGLLYGMSVGGGQYHYGVILSFNDTTWQETVVNAFGRRNRGTTTGPDGVYPNGSLIQASNGLLYGMTESGGVNNDGIVFSYAIGADTDITIHSFDQTEGSAPYGDLIEVDTPVFTTGINQLTVNSEQLSVYPNPSTGLVTITSTKNISAITVTNLVGQTKLKSPSGDLGVTRQIDLSAYPPGMYFITVTTVGETETSKLILEK